jgi:hypothetical protein
MLFRELKIGDRFEWDDIIFHKTGITTAKGNGSELVFPGALRVRISLDRVCQ